MAYDGPSSGAPHGVPPGQRPEYPTSPPAGGWQDPGAGHTGYVPAPPPQRRGFKDLWLHPAIVVGVLGTLVILIVAVTVLAVRSFQTPATVTADDSHTSSADPADDSGSTGENSDTSGSGNGAEESPSDGPAPQDPVYLSGVLDGYPDSQFDFDGGDDYIDYDDDEKTFDAEVAEDGLRSMNMVEFGEWTESAPPTTIDQCTGVETKSDTVHLSRMQQYATFCFTTAEGRTGYLTIDEVELDDNGTLNDLTVSFTVWKGPDDL